MTLPAFTPVFERLCESPLSTTEPEALAALWAHGEDGWLREDPRFRPTPWGRWIPSERYLANDLLVEALREGASELSLAEQLAALALVVGRPAAVCPADPRLRVEGDRARLAPSELTADPLLEDVGPLLQFVTHLPVLTLQAAAASEPAGEWGARAEPQRVDPLGWLRVERLGKPLNRRMFVARVKGHSMDGGARPIEDGAWGLFEFCFHEGLAYDAGRDQPIVLVRGEFRDPETGSYAIKRWDRHAPEIRLVSLNPDKTRFPDIVVPFEAADPLRVVASYTRVLGPADYARRPKPQRLPGRRVVDGRGGLDEQSARLERRIDAFFEGLPDPDDEDEAPSADGWRSRLVCLGAEAGGLHVELGPLLGLPPFVKKLRVVGAEDRDAVLLAANARLRAARAPMFPASGPWRVEAIGFEDEADLGLDRLAAEALPVDAVSVFRLDAVGDGQRQAGRTLALGQVYRLLLPPGLGEEGLGQPLTSGWRLWTVNLTAPPSPLTHTALQALGLSVGEAWPRLSWALTPPVAWRTTARGELYPVFETGAEVAVQVCGLPGEDAEDAEPASVFFGGPSGVERLTLPLGGEALVSLGALSAGRWACALIHPQTAVRTTTLVFEVAEAAVPRVDAAWTVSVEASPDGGVELSTLVVSAPPGWPVTFSWRALSVAPLATVHADEDGGVEVSKVSQALVERARRVRVGDVLVDLAELGSEARPCDRRPTVEQVRAQLSALWNERQGMVRARRGAWLALIPAWFTPVCALLGYTLEERRATTAHSPDDDPNGLAVWRLLVDERDGAALRRRAPRVLVLTEDLDATLRDRPDALDRACTDPREAILTDGVRWTLFRRGNRRRQTVWDLGEALTDDSFEALLATLAEGV